MNTNGLVARKIDPALLPPVRIAYVGPNMDLAKAAYLQRHLELGHQVEYYLRPEDIPEAPKPDVVITLPLVQRNDRVEGPCLLTTLVEATTLIVALGVSHGQSYSMWVKHALEGRCHDRILIHNPTPSMSASDVVEEINRRARQPGPITETTASLPNELLLNGAKRDLGQLMDERNMGDFLWHAATADWAMWSELATKLGLAEGTVKNRMKCFAVTAKEAGLIDKGTEQFRIVNFIRFLAAHYSFINSYVHHTRLQAGVPPANGVSVPACSAI